MTAMVGVIFQLILYLTQKSRTFMGCGFFKIFY